MRKIIILSVVAICSLQAALAQNVLQKSKWQWAKAIPGRGLNQIVGMSVDVNGDLFITGGFGPGTNFGNGVKVNNGGDDFYVAKFSPEGEHIWSFTDGTSGYDEGYSVTSDSAGNAYVTGNYGGDTFGGIGVGRNGEAVVASFTTNGVLRWATKLPYNRGAAICVLKNGLVSVSGFTSGYDDAFVAHLASATGLVVNQKRTTTNNFGGTIITNSTPSGDSAFIVCGTTTDGNFLDYQIPSGSGTSKSFVAKVSTSGRVIFFKEYTNSSLVYKVKSISTGGFYLLVMKLTAGLPINSTSISTNRNELIILRCDDNGEIQKAYRTFTSYSTASPASFFPDMVINNDKLGVTAGIYNQSVLNLPSGNLTVAANSIMVQIIDSTSGEIKSVKTTGGSIPAASSGIFASGVDNFKITGWFSNTISLDSISLIGNGPNDWNMLFANLAPAATDLSPKNVVFGKIYKSLTNNCQQDSSEIGYGFRIVRAEPSTYYGYSNGNGDYQINVGSGAYTIRPVADVRSLLMQRVVCPSPQQSYSVAFAGLSDTVSGKDFAIEEVTCPFLEVSVGSDRRRRCVNNRTTVRYENSGLGTANNVVLHLKFPRYVRYQSSSVSMAYNPIDSTYSTDLGSVLAGTQGTIAIIDSVVCEADIRGVQQCTKVWLTSSNGLGTACLPVPSGYDGSDIEVVGSCIDFTQTFTIKNIGRDMSRTRMFSIYVDTVLAAIGNFNLQSGDSLIYSVAGVNLRSNVSLEAMEDSLNPYERVASGNSTCGNVLLSIGNGGYAPSDESPVVDIDCQPIRDSYDPNDITVTPKGQTVAGFVPPGTKFEFKIRFKNKGNDTAYSVRIMDTLSGKFDLSSLELGVSSHRMTPKVVGVGEPVLVFQFDNINLVDSATNDSKSGGFVTFRIKAKEGLREGTTINNKAEIFFDFNPAVATNTTINTILTPVVVPGIVDSDSVIVLALKKNNLKPEIKIYPNPTRGQLFVALAEQAEIQLFSSTGMLVKLMNGQKGKNAVNVNGLSNGIYFVKVSTPKGYDVRKVVVESN